MTILVKNLWSKDYWLWVWLFTVGASESWSLKPFSRANSSLLTSIYWWNNELRLKYSKLKDMWSYPLPFAAPPCSSLSPKDHFGWMRTVLINQSRILLHEFLGQGRVLALGLLRSCTLGVQSWQVFLAQFPSPGVLGSNWLCNSLLAHPGAFCGKQEARRQILITGRALIDITCVLIGRGEGSGYGHSRKKKAWIFPAFWKL